MDSLARLSFLRLLAMLRGFAVIGQALTIWLVAGPMHVPLDTLPLWAGVALLALFNVWAVWRIRRGRTHPAETVLHLAVDIVVLAWMVAFSGGLNNPFGSLFLLPIALAALALPARQGGIVAALAVVGYLLSALFATPLPHVHGGVAGLFDLHLGGMAANFLLSVAVVVFFFGRMRGIRQRQEHEIAELRERFARSEGILALATHAASVAHELNTPLATLMLMLDETDGELPLSAEDRVVMRQLVDQCRDRVRELAQPANGPDQRQVELAKVIEHWQLVRPAIELTRDLRLPGDTRVEPAVGHLLQALLNNAADASEAAGSRRVHLAMSIRAQWLHAEIRDEGPASEPERPFLPPSLFHSSKPAGLGLGLALSHATVERLGGHLGMAAGHPSGTRVHFSLPLQTASA
ncbi:MAG: ATP-binding protein [Lysobacteraceae bacterium]